MDGQILGLDFDLFVTETGLIVAGLAAIIGIWVERDPNRPKRYAIWLSALIALATGVGMFQCYDDDQDQKKVEADLARVLQQLDKIASSSEVDIPALNDLIKTELASQSRANPGVVADFAQRVADEGEDPGDVLSAYLPEAEVEDLKRKQNVKPASKPKAPEPAPAAAADAAGETVPASLPRSQRRKALTFGGGAPKLRAPLAAPKEKPPEETAAKEEPAKPEPSAVPSSEPEAKPTLRLPGADKGPAPGVRPIAPPTAQPKGGAPGKLPPAGLKR